MKMTEEEKDLYDWIKLGSSISDDDARVLRRKVREVVRAVEERCAKVADSFHEPPYPSTTSSMYTVPQKIANAIREGK